MGPYSSNSTAAVAAITVPAASEVERMGCWVCWLGVLVGLVVGLGGALTAASTSASTLTRRLTPEWILDSR